jgi:hypothetical protein
MIVPCFVPRDGDIDRLRGAIVDFRTAALRRLVERRPKLDERTLTDLRDADTAFEALGQWAWEGKDEHHAFDLADPVRPRLADRAHALRAYCRAGASRRVDAGGRCRPRDRIARFGGIGAALTAINVIAPSYAEEFGR